MVRAIMNVEEVALYLGFSEKKIYRLLESHQIPASRIGRQYRFLKETIDSWLEDKNVFENPAPKDIHEEFKSPSTMIQDEIIQKFVSQAKQVLRPKVKRVYLFGSRARGQEREDSDYDFLVIVKANFSSNDKEKLYDIVLEILLETGELVSLKIFKEEKFEQLYKMKTPFLERVLKEGVQVG